MAQCKVPSTTSVGLCLCAVVLLCLSLNTIMFKRHNDIGLPITTDSPIQIARRQKIQELLEIVREMHRQVFSINFTADANYKENIRNASQLDAMENSKNASQRVISSDSQEHGAESGNYGFNYDKRSSFKDRDVNLWIFDNELYHLSNHQGKQDANKKKKAYIANKIRYGNQIKYSVKVGANVLDKFIWQPKEETSKTMQKPKEFYGRDISYAKASCNASLRNTLKLSPVFRDRYIADVPILIYHSMFSPREYYQRKEYQSPFGFKNTSYEDLYDDVKLLRSKAHRSLFDHQSGSKSRCRRCAVVGKLRSLLKSRSGSMIDSYDNVFRANFAPTRGFEEDVGKKTTHYFYTFSSLIESRRISDKHGLQFMDTLAKKDVKYISSDADESTYKYLHGLLTNQKASQLANIDSRKRRPLLLPRNTPGSFRLLHPDLLRYTSDRWINVTNVPGGTLDLELTMLIVALQTCDEVAVFGLGRSERSQRKASRKRRLRNEDEIDGAKIELLSQLNNKGIIKWYS